MIFWPVFNLSFLQITIYTFLNRIQQLDLPTHQSKHPYWWTQTLTLMNLQDLSVWSQLPPIMTMLYHPFKVSTRARTKRCVMVLLTFLLHLSSTIQRIHLHIFWSFFWLHSTSQCSVYLNHGVKISAAGRKMTKNLLQCTFNKTLKVRVRET